MPDVPSAEASDVPVSPEVDPPWFEASDGPDVPPSVVAAAVPPWEPLPAALFAPLPSPLEDVASPPSPAVVPDEVPTSPEVADVLWSASAEPESPLVPDEEVGEAVDDPDPAAPDAVPVDEELPDEPEAPEPPDVAVPVPVAVPVSPEAPEPPPPLVVLDACPGRAAATGLSAAATGAPTRRRAAAAVVARRVLRMLRLAMRSFLERGDGVPADEPTPITAQLGPDRVMDGGPVRWLGTTRCVGASPSSDPFEPIHTGRESGPSASRAPERCATANNPSDDGCEAAG